MPAAEVAAHYHVRGHFPTLAEVEKRHVARALEKTGGNRSQAARLLGIARSTLLRKIVAMGLDGASDQRSR